MTKPTIAGLQADLEVVTKERDALRAELTDALGSVERQADAAEAARKRASGDAERIEVLETENRQLAASLRAYKGSATKARNEVDILKREKSPVGRKVGAPAAVPTMPLDAYQSAVAKRRVAIEDALREGPVELVFSDGRAEIRELAPLLVTGPAFRRTAKAEILDADILLEPGDMGRPEVAVAGVAMLNEAGEQVGWCQFPEAVRVGRNARMSLPKGAIRF